MIAELQSAEAQGSFLLAAPEVHLVNAMNGTSLGTFSAGGALVVVDHSKIVNDRDRLRGTNARAFTAADTAVFAVFSGERTLVPV